MIRIVVTKRVSPDNVATFEGLTRELVAGSRAEEGCVDYSINKSVQEDGLYAIFEVWASNEALEAHQKTEHFTRLVPLIGEYAVTESFGVFSEI